MSDPLDLVSVYRAANSIEANFVKNLMADEGIQAVVSEENEPLAGLEVVPPDVLVRVADEERARAFIVQYEERQIEKANAPADEEDDFDEFADEDDVDEIESLDE